MNNRANHDLNVFHRSAETTLNIHLPYIDSLYFLFYDSQFALASGIINIYIYRGKYLITDPLIIPTPSRISVTIRYINKLYI